MDDDIAIVERFAATDELVAFDSVAMDDDVAVDERLGAFDNLANLVGATLCEFDGAIVRAGTTRPNTLLSTTC